MTQLENSTKNAEDKKRKESRIEQQVIQKYRIFKVQRIERIKRELRIASTLKVHQY